MMYDAFLSYNTKDRAAVEAIALYLKDKAGLKVFFDRWAMIPGTPVQETLEKALTESASCVVFIGPSGLGIYQNEETRIALEKSISKKNLRVIPVLLPGGKRETKESELPPFLRRLSWVEFDDDPLDPDSLRRLVCGIKNLSPGPGTKPMVPPMERVEPTTRPELQSAIERPAQAVIKSFLKSRNLFSKRFLSNESPKANINDEFWIIYS